MGSKNNLTLLKPEKVSEDPSLHTLLQCFPLRQSSSSSPAGVKLEGQETTVAFSRGGVGSAGVNMSLISCVWDVGTVRTVQAVKAAGVTGLGESPDVIWTLDGDKRVED